MEPEGSASPAEPKQTSPSVSRMSRGEETYPLSILLRVLSGAAGIAMLALLLTAAYLEPASSGIGTHQQLGLPRCTFVELWGIRCPACGMTTSWSLALRGRLVEAAATNVGGLMLAIIALAYIPASCYFCISGRSSRRNWFSLALATALTVSLLTATFQWTLRLLNG